MTQSDSESDSFRHFLSHFFVTLGPTPQSHFFVTCFVTLFVFRTFYGGNKAPKSREQHQIEAVTGLKPVKQELCGKSHEKVRPNIRPNLCHAVSLSSVRFLKCDLAGKTIERGEKTPTPKISALLRKRPVLLRANFVLTKDRKRPYYGHFCGKIHREGSCSKAAEGP